MQQNTINLFLVRAKYNCRQSNYKSYFVIVFLCEVEILRMYLILLEKIA